MNIKKTALLVGISIFLLVILYYLYSSAKQDRIDQLEMYSSAKQDRIDQLERIDRTTEVPR